jgi:hypothetical protein
MKAYWGSGGVALLILWPRHHMGMNDQLHAPAALPLRERDPGTNWVGGWVDPKAVLDAVVKRKIPSLRRESSPRTSIIHLARSPALYRLSYHGSSLSLSRPISLWCILILSSRLRDKYPNWNHGYDAPQEKLKYFWGGGADGVIWI